MILNENLKSIKTNETDLKAERDEKIKSMWLACYTQEEIADEVNQDQKTITNVLNSLGNLESLPKFLKNFAEFNDPEFQIPIYNLWINEHFPVL